MTRPMTRPKYSGTASVCAKCGSLGGHGVVYRTPEVWVARTASGESVPLSDGLDGDEWLERTCSRCGYGWQEACVDADTV